MNHPIDIFVPEWVPLENKGEEAIIRGMGDVLFSNKKVDFHILDMNIKKYKYESGFHIYPGSWFYSKWRTQEFGLGLSLKKIYSSICSLIRNGLDVITPSWVLVPQRPLRITRKMMRKIVNGKVPKSEKEIALYKILKCNYIIAGHDGALNEYVCHTIDMMLQFGMQYGIFGTSMRPNVKSKAIIKIFRKTLEKAKFIYCRNINALEWAQKHFPDLKNELAPDPAFGMIPSSKESTVKLIEAEGLKNLFEKPVVMFVSSEPAPISRSCFEKHRSFKAKINAHRNLIAALVRHVINSYDVNILFLPHATGPGMFLDDRIISHDIIRRSKAIKERVGIIDREISARELKGLMREASLIVSERIHAIIGSAGVITPFICLGSTTDSRVSDIVGKMLSMKDCIYYLNQPIEEELLHHYDYIWSIKAELRKRLEIVNGAIEEKLKAAAKNISGNILGK